MQGWLNNLYGGTVSENEDGVYGGKGLTAAILKPFVDEQQIETKKQKGAVKRTIVAAGEDPADYNLGPGATRYDAQGAVATTRRERAEKEKQGDQTRALEVVEAGQKPQMAQIAANTKATEDQTQLLREQLLQQAREANLTRAENAEIRADNLALQRMQMEREDMRYNERMELLDRRDRKQGRQSLVAGLAALGAAFAL